MLAVPVRNPKFESSSLTTLTKVGRKNLFYKVVPWPPHACFGMHMLAMHAHYTYTCTHMHMHTCAHAYTHTKTHKLTVIKNKTMLKYYLLHIKLGLNSRGILLWTLHILTPFCFTVWMKFSGYESNDLCKVWPLDPGSESDSYFCLLSGCYLCFKRIILMCAYHCVIIQYMLMWYWFKL